MIRYLKCFIIIGTLSLNLVSFASADVINITSIIDVKGCGQPIKKKGLSMKIYRFISFGSVKRTDVSIDQYSLLSPKIKKGRAILMAILTGPLGGHRLYLGTKPYVPIVYTLTLGGGMGLLPLIDVFVILFSDDLSKLQNNNQIIMWGNQ